jgi:hypothetical protein
LCGTVVRKTPQRLDSLAVTTNGSYFASAYDVDGFYRVDVQVETSETEELEVTPLFAGGENMLVYPSNNKVISKMTILKPQNLLSENIKKGVEVAGVTGSYEVILGSHTYTANGT